MELDQLRTQIDSIDDQIASLYAKRLEISAEVGKEKAKVGAPLSVSTREKEIINRITKDKPEQVKIYLKQLYDLAFLQSKNHQAKYLGVTSKIVSEIENVLNKERKNFPVSATVACQGVQGAYSGIATEKLFEISDITYFNNFEAVFNAVDKGLCEYGVLPIENSNAGSVSQVYDLMKRHNFYIVKSIRLQICHALAVKKGKEGVKIKKVYSHEQALQQCAEYLKKLGVETVAVENTAIAGKMVAESNEDGVAAICSEECAKIFGLSVVEKGVQDNGNNFTRFICISKNLEIYKGADKISVMTSLENRSGSLNMMLSRFAAQGLNLTKLESRPVANSQFEFMFYFDFEGDIESDGVLNLLGELDNSSDRFVFMGSYKEIF